MSAAYTIGLDGEEKPFANAEAFLRDLDMLLSYKVKGLVASAPKHARDAFERINGLFKKHNIEVVLTIDSDPEAVDYLINAMVGGIAGAAVGALGGIAAAGVANLGVVGIGTVTVAYFVGGGTAALASATALGVFAPGLGWVIGGAGVGLGVGITAGMAVTRMGLRVQFASLDKSDKERVKLELAPTVA